MRHVSRWIWLPILLCAVGCAHTPSIAVEALATEAQPVTLSWGQLKVELSAEPDHPMAVSIQEIGDEFRVFWDRGYLVFRPAGDRILAHSGHDPVPPGVPMPTVYRREDYAFGPIGSGSFQGGLSLRLEPKGRVSLLSSANKWEAVPPKLFDFPH